MADIKAFYAPFKGRNADQFDAGTGEPDRLAPTALHTQISDAIRAGIVRGEGLRLSVSYVSVSSLLGPRVGTTLLLVAMAGVSVPLRSAVRWRLRRSSRSRSRSAKAGKTSVSRPS